MPVIDVGFDKHLVTCPHCQEQTLHLWPGSTILFATTECTHCGGEFLIVQNEPRL
jgi:hypothetical protein